MRQTWGNVAGVVTILLMVVFIGIWVWAWRPRHKRKFDEMARLPMDEEDAPHVEKDEVERK